MTSFKEQAFQDLVGVWFCPQAVFADDFEVDEDGMTEVYEHCMRMEAGGIGYTVLMEPWSSTHAERRRGVELLADVVRRRTKTYANVTDHSAAETIALANHALSAGLDYVLFNCPYEWAKSEAMMIDFYNYVIDRVEGPVLLYNTAHSGMFLRPEVISQLSEKENVVGIKNAINQLDHSIRVHELCGDRLVVSDPMEHNYLPAIKAYGQQVLLTTSGALLMQTPRWQPVRDYSALAREGRLAEAEAVAAEIEPLRALYLKAYSRLWDLQHAFHPMALTKRWQGLMGIPGGLVRPPFPQAADEDVNEVIETLRPFAERYGIDLPVPAAA